MVFRHWVELEDGTVALNPAPTADDDTLATSTFYSQVLLHKITSVCCSSLELMRRVQHFICLIFHLQK